MVCLLVAGTAVVTDAAGATDTSDPVVVNSTARTDAGVSEPAVDVSAPAATPTSTPSNGTAAGPATRTPTSNRDRGSTPTTGPGETPTPAGACEFEPEPSVPDERGWRTRFSAPIETNATADRSGGSVARVGADGDCSLVVARGESATLTATTVDASRGVLAATVDLGADGSVAFVDRNGSVGLAVENVGPDYGTAAVVRAGNRSERVRLPSGRFVRLVVRWENGTALVSVGEADETFDGERDRRFPDAGAPADGDWLVRLGGRVFVDGVAVGTVEPVTPTPTPTATPTPDEGAFPDVEPDDSESEPSEPVPERGGDGRAFVGVLFLVLGAVSARYAYGVARLGEQIDAIGSTTPASTVEPTGWNVALTRIGGVVLALIGLAMLASGLL